MIRGAIFSIDSMLAFIIILIAVFAFLTTLSDYENRVSSSARSFYLEEKTILAADSFVKNNSVENGLLGSAIFDFDKKRVKSNELSSIHFSSFSDIQIGNFFIKSIKSKTNTFYESELEGIECIGVKRFVLLDLVKTIITYTGCLSE